jgi:multisubunit Na+/H+ antiporter MnhG subunit
MFNIFTTLLTIFVFIGLVAIMYSFLGIFMHKKKKRIIVTIVIALLGLSIYFYETNKHVVYMKEDIMYVKPLPKPDK